MSQRHQIAAALRRLANRIEKRDDNRSAALDVITEHMRKELDLMRNDWLDAYLTHQDRLVAMGAVSQEQADASIKRLHTATAFSRPERSA